MDADINIHFYKVTALPLSIITPESFMCTLALFHSTPLLVMCIVYFVVWKKQKTIMDNQNHGVREKKLAKTLFIITAASLSTSGSHF